jgi:hypothetical protein
MSAHPQLKVYFRDGGVVEAQPFDDSSLGWSVGSRSSEEIPTPEEVLSNGV